MTTSADKDFAGSIPHLYERHLVPLIFQPYALDLARRLEGRPMARLLEVAAGTGVVTRALDRVLPQAVSIVASDLNQAMVDEAAAQGTGRAVEWRQADVMRLPFAESEFDVVVCQFGAMFFPDKPAAFAEVRRVLRPGGLFIFNVWDRIEKNDFVHAVMGALEALYPQDPPRFMVRSPHGYFDTDTISRDLALGGFAGEVQIDSLAVRSRAASARSAAIGYCQANPMRVEIESHGPSSLAEATDAAEEALLKRFGAGPIEGGIQALVVSVER